METQIKAFYPTTNGHQVVTIFGYATKGVPSLEICGAGKLSKSIKEKLIFLTRTRKLKIPMRRFVLCVDADSKLVGTEEEIKNLEFPLLLLYWYLCGLLPMRKLDDCLCSGTIRANGEIRQPVIPNQLNRILLNYFDPVELKSLKIIGQGSLERAGLNMIETSLLLEHIPSIKIRSYMDNASAIPLKSFIA